MGSPAPCYDRFRGYPDHDCDRCPYRQSRSFCYIDDKVRCFEFRQRGRATACRISCEECEYFCEKHDA